MPQTASWIGTPSIKGSTESMRMALLTFSLVGLQSVTFSSPSSVFFSFFTHKQEMDGFIAQIKLIDRDVPFAGLHGELK